MADLEGKLKVKKRHLQRLPGLDKELATLRSKVERRRMAMIQLQLESDAVFEVLFEIWVHRNNEKQEVTKVIALKKRKLPLDAKLLRNSKHAAAAN